MKCGTKSVIRRISLASVTALLLLPKALQARCGPPTRNIARGRIEGAAVIERLFAFGLANKICLGVEFDDDELLRSMPEETVRGILNVLVRSSKGGI